MDHRAIQRLVQDQPVPCASSREVSLQGSTKVRRTTNILRRTGFPMVEIMSPATDPMDINIGLDHHQAARDLAHHVISKGYKRSDPGLA